MNKRLNNFLEVGGLIIALVAMLAILAFLVFPSLLQAWLVQLLGLTLWLIRLAVAGAVIMVIMGIFAGVAKIAGLFAGVKHKKLENDLLAAKAERERIVTIAVNEGQTLFANTPLIEYSPNIMTVKPNHDVWFNSRLVGGNIIHGQPTYHKLTDNPQSQAVPLPDHVELLELLPGRVGDLDNLILGVAANNGAVSPVTISLESFVHGLVAGASGWGKSVLARSIAYQLATARQSIELVMIDLEGVTFSTFAGLNRLVYPLCDSEAGAIAILDDCLGELERRKGLFSRYPLVEKLSEYNQVADITIPPRVILNDEVTTLLSKSKPFKQRMIELKLRGRKYGIYGVDSGQDFKANIMTTELRNQYSSRIQLKANDQAQSRIVLGDGIAADITQPGRAYVILPGRVMTELQTPYLSKADCLSVAGRSDQPDQVDQAQWAFVSSRFDLEAWLLANPVAEVSRKDRPGRVLFLASQGVDQLADIVGACYKTDGTNQRDYVIKIVTEAGYIVEDNRIYNPTE